MKTLSVRFYIVLSIVFFMGIWRVLSHEINFENLPNFTPICAMALFGGAYFGRPWKAFFMPMATLFVSDIVIMNVYFSEYSNGLLYSGWYWTYIAFFLMVIVGRALKTVSFWTVCAGAISTALIHWVVSDIGPWYYGLDITTSQPFPRNFTGYLKCLYLALPFLKNMIVGNLIFCGLFFGGFEYAKARISLA